jgi:hypothetical protein
MVTFTFMSGLIFFILFSSVMSINNQCDNNNIFILISTKTVFLFNFDSQNYDSPSIAYQTKLNTTIEYGLFHKRTNTIILLINQSNETYSIISLNTFDNIYDYWNEKSANIIYSSYVYLSTGEKYFYTLNPRTMLLEIFTLPLTSTAYKQNNLSNLPRSSMMINYVIDEKFHLLWIIFKNIQYQLYKCDLKTSSCYLYMNMFNIYNPIQFSINLNYQQLYIYSVNYLIILEYNQTQTDYSMDYLNSTKQNQFLTICERKNSIEYISINYTNKRQVCLHSCQYLPSMLNDTSRIHTIQRLPSLSDILYCSKQSHISKSVIMVLILIDLAAISGAIVWLAYKYSYESKLRNYKRQKMSIATVWTVEPDLITFF